jgi:hypothetical protein
MLTEAERKENRKSLGIKKKKVTQTNRATIQEKKKICRLWENHCSLISFYFNQFFSI